MCALALRVRFGWRDYSAAAGATSIIYRVATILFQVLGSVVMALGFEDFEIIVEPCPGAPPGVAWLWSVRQRRDAGILLFGRHHGGRTAACGDAALAVFQMLAAAGNDRATRYVKPTGA
jgi:hypothetical protein